MQTADSLLCPGRANYIRPRFGRPSARRLLIQSEMSSVVVIIANIFEPEPHQMSLVQRYHVIQHLTAYAPHPSFRDSVLPRTANARPDSFDPARFQKAAHLGAELAVTIKDNVAVSAGKRQCLSKLLQNPIAGRMRGGVEMKNAAPMISITKKQYSTRKLSVGTVKKSKAAITSRWFCRNAPQRCTFDWSGWRFSRCR
jgi:hypothetical protein